MCGVTAGVRDRVESLIDDVAVNKVRVQESADEVSIFLPEGAQFRDAQVFFVQAPTGELRVALRSCGVDVLDPHQA